MKHFKTASNLVLQVQQIGQVIKPAVDLPKNVSKSLRTQMVLGSPSAGCRDVGLCRVIPADMSVTCQCPVLTGWISLTSAGRLRIAFEFESLAFSDFRRHFGWGLFQVLESFEMPLFVHRFLKQKYLIVQPGVYPVFTKGNLLIVDFDLREVQHDHASRNSKVFFDTD